MKVRRWLAALAMATIWMAGAMGSLQGQEPGPRRGWLGFTYEGEIEGGPTSVRIESVYPGSPAARAGVRAGDEIVRWNGNADVQEALETLRLEPGDTVRLRIRRGDGRARDVQVVAAERPRNLIAIAPERPPRPPEVSPEQWERWQEELRERQEALRRSQSELERALRERGRAEAFRMDSLGEAIGRAWRERFRMDSLAIHADSLHRGLELMLRDSLGPRLEALSREFYLWAPEGGARALITTGGRAVAGAEFEEMNPGLATYFGTDRGVLVLRVSEGTPADRSGLRAGDVVLEVNDREVNSVNDLRTAMSRAQRSRPRAVQLEILRRGERRELDLGWE